MQVDVNVEILFLYFCSVLFTPRSLIVFYSQGAGGEEGEGGEGEEGWRILVVLHWNLPDSP